MPDFKLSDLFPWRPGNEWRTSEEAETLFEICKSCPNLKLDDKFCSKCFCYMPKKVYFKEYHCPINNW
jgi:ribosomal protein L32